jgi:zinc transport system ATP-binding protein
MRSTPALPASTPLLIAENLRVSSAGTRILDGVSVEVRRGEIVTLIGPNGSGKTTLVRALLGLVQPDSGRVVRNAQRVGYVPQAFARDRSLPLTPWRFVAGFGGGSEAAAFETRRFSAISKGVEAGRAGVERILL